MLEAYRWRNHSPNSLKGFRRALVDLPIRIPLVAFLAVVMENHIRPFQDICPDLEWPDIGMVLDMEWSRSSHIQSLKGTRQSSNVAC